VEATAATTASIAGKSVTKDGQARTTKLPRHCRGEQFVDTAILAINGLAEAELDGRSENPGAWLPPDRHAALLEECDFTDCTFAQPLSGIRFRRCRFIRCKFHTELRGVELDACTFKGCNLSWSSFLSCKLKFSQFTDNTFSATVFVRCDLYRASFFAPDNTFSDATFTLVSISRTSLDGTSGIDGGSFLPRVADATLVPGPDVPDLDDQEARERRRMALVEAGDRPALVQEDLAEYRNMLEQTGHLTRNIHPTLNGRLAEAAGVWRMLSGVFNERGEYRDAARAYVSAKCLERSDANPLRKRYLLPRGQASGSGTRLGHDGHPEWPVGRTLSRLPRRTIRFVVLLLADALCGFGDAYGRILIWLGGLTALLGLVLTLGDGLRWERVIRSTAGDKIHLARVDFLEAWEFALGQLATSPAKQFRLQSTGWALAASTETLLGLALVGLLGFVFANRIRFA
jgi:Pentapeptide repeats (9 copies)